MNTYPVVFTKEDNNYIAIFPDFNYLSTYGSTLVEANEMASDALAGTLGLMSLENEPFPSPTPIDQIDVDQILKNADLESVDSTKALITVDVDSYIKKYLTKSIRKSVTIPSWLDIAAKASNLNLSKLLQQAIKKEIGLS